MSALSPEKYAAFMSNQVLQDHSGSAVIDGRTIDPIENVQLDTKLLKVHLQGQEHLNIYAFNALMLQLGDKRKGIERYVLSGPRLGIYYDVVDVREGPFVNHYLHELDITIEYGEECAIINMQGVSDLSRSSFDHSWYKGPTTGTWQCAVTIRHTF